MYYKPLLVSGIVFALTALLQLLRIYLQFPIEIAGVSIPVWFNIILLFLFSFLSLWIFYNLGKSSKECCHKDDKLE